MKSRGLLYRLLFRLGVGVPLMCVTFTSSALVTQQGCVRD